MSIPAVTKGSDGSTFTAPPAGTSPMVRVARTIPWARGYRGRERAATFAVFCFSPSAAFWIWFLVGVRHNLSHHYHALVYAMPLASLWILMGPMLVQQWEFDFESLMARLIETKRAGGWDLDAIWGVAHRADRAYYWIMVPGTLATPAAFWIAYPYYESDLALRGLAEQVTGLAVMLIVGFVNSSGLWGAFKSVAVVRASTRGAAPEWRPFRPDQPNGLPELNRFCWSTAVEFSAGSVLLPALYVVQEQVPTATAVIILVFVVVLAVGGLVLFTVPTRWLRQLGQAQRQRTLVALAPLLERTMAQAGDLDGQPDGEVQRRWYALDIALRLRSEIATSDPLPLPRLITRAATTLVLPALLTLVQIALTSATSGR